jgi:hypothetical protein
VLASIVVMSLAALWGGAVWLRHETVTMPKYKVDPRYATQTHSRAAVEKAFLRWGGQGTNDKLNDACEARSVAGWAAFLGTAPTAKAVALELAQSVDPAFRHQAYLGCLTELRGPPGA